MKDYKIKMLWALPFLPNFNKKQQIYIVEKINKVTGVITEPPKVT